MRRFIPLLALLLLPIASAQAQGLRDAQVTQIDTAGYPAVSAFVRVTDSAGQLVPGLTQSDFTITEDGQPVAIEAFAGGGASSITTVLVVDHSGSMEEADKIDGARDAARAFVEQMRPSDQTALLGFSERNDLLQSFTNDQHTLNQAIRKLRPSDGTALYDAVIAGVDQLDGASGRRVLLVLTDGQDCREPSGCGIDHGSVNTLDQAIAYASKKAQTVYVVGLGERDSDDTDGIDETVLKRIASGTGGAYFYAPDAAKLADLYRSLAGDVQQEYRLTYRSPRPFYDGTRRDIRVSVGGTEASGGYLERHMIDVRSSPSVAALLLAPLALMFALPPLLRRRHTGAFAPTVQSVPIVADGALVEPPQVIVVASNAQRCQHCDAALRPNARFCAQCGARA